MVMDEKVALKQIDEALVQYDALRRQSQYEDLSDLQDHAKRTEVAARLSSTLIRFAPPGSHYEAAIADLRRHGATTVEPFLVSVPGLLRALRAEYAAGYLRSLEELIHADLFANFLEMADYLLNEGYKDPAAVLAGGVLEEHLRQLCKKHGVTATDAGRPKKAERMNADLATVPAHSKLDQKNITAWLDLRNKAAHGRYNEYEAEQVRLMVMGVREFAGRVPA